MMKRFFLFLLIFLITVSFSYTESIINDFEYFSKYFPRPEGSSNEKETIVQISERLNSLGVAYKETSFTETEGFHSFSSYIEAEIPGQSNETLITVVPAESSYGISAALYFADYYNKNTPQLTLKFIFLGAETSAEKNLGTRNFLEHFYPESESVFLYFNFSGAPATIGIRAGADNHSSPFFLYDSVTASLREAGIPYFHSNTESILFRLSAVGRGSMIHSYLEEGYPAIELYSYNEVSADQESMVKGTELIAFYLKLLDDFAEGIPQEWDNHYIFGFSEQIYIIVYIIILTLLMVYPIFRRKHFGWYMKTLKKNFWSLPLLFGFIFIILSLSSLLLGFILERMGFPELWQYKPLVVFLFKIFFALLLYSLAFRAFSKLPFSKKGSFYSISALFFLVIALLILTLIDLSLSFFALWPLCFIFLLTVFRKPAVKFLMLLISALWLFFALTEIFNLPSLSVIEYITMLPVQGNLLISLVIMPFILAAIRLEMLAPLPHKITRLLPAVLGAASAALLIVILFYSPFNEENPQPVRVTEVVDLNSETREFKFDSPSRLNTATHDKIIDAVARSDEEEMNMDINVQTKPFLNRKIIDTSINLSLQPERISLTLNSDSPLTLYESSFPAQWLPAQKRLDVYIGNNPPIPLQISLTLNRTARPEYRVEADFPRVQFRKEIDGESYLISHYSSIIKRYTDD